MRNILFSLVTAVAISLFPTAILQAAPTSAVSAQRTKVEPGASIRLQPGSPAAPAAFDLEVSVQNTADLGGFEFDVVYDRAAAQITGITPGGFFGQATQCDVSTMRCATGLGPVHKSDRTRVGAYSYGAAPGATGVGLLAVIHVQTNGNPAALSFALANPLVVDSQGKPITQNVTLALIKRSGAQLFLPMIGR